MGTLRVIALSALMAVLPPVYHPHRLKPLQPMVERTGVVASVQYAQDGDAHLNLRLSNGKLLVAEIVCVRKPKRPKAAIGACQGYTNHILVPKVGQRVQVRGPLVWDTAHGWQEIHPVVELTELSP